MIRFLQTPGPIKKIVLSGILLVFCGAMVITRIPGGLGTDLGVGSPSAGVVANVGGEQVTRDEVQREAQGMLRQQFPKGSPMSGQLLPFFAGQAAQQLINQKGLVNEAKRMGLRATNDDVLDELQHGRFSATFFPNGKFIGQAQYEALLQNAELSVPQFEEGLKQDILVTKLRDLITGPASVTDADLRQEFEKKYTKVKFQYAVISEADLRKGIHPSEAELKAFYERNKATYNNSIPEQRKIAYTMLDTA